jgi:hypothetical protein
VVGMRPRAREKKNKIVKLNLINYIFEIYFKNRLSGYYL